MPVTQPNVIALRSLAAVIAVVLVAGGIVLLVNVTKNPIGNPSPSPTAGGTPNAPSSGERTPTPVLNGTVTKVTEDSITFSVIGVPAESGLKYESSVRTARLTNETEIRLLTDRSGQEMKRLFEKFAEDVKKADPLNQPTPPATFTSETISITDIKEGDVVMATSVDNENISEKIEFTASVITIHRTQ